MADVHPTIRLLDYADPGAGKCESLGTPILLYDGTIIPIEHVEVDDLLMGPDSQPRRVLSLAQGEGEMYRVTPVKGDPYEVNRNHILSLQHIWHGPEKMVCLSVDDWMQKDPTFQCRAKGWRTGVDFADSVQLPELLPPYLLGLWLGDGTSSGERFEIDKPDHEIRDYLAQYAQEFGFRFTSKDDRHRIKREEGVQANRLTAVVRQLDLPFNKHIPFIYKTASREARLSLLAGLLDTDGSLSRGCFGISSKFDQLAFDILYLARSLGFAAYDNPGWQFCQTGGGGFYHRILISGPTHLIPTRIVRKQAKPREQIKNVLRTGIEIEPVGKDAFYGFELDGDGLYLHGDFTVTHNSTFAATFPKPMLVFFMDTAGKEQPYFDRGLDYGGDVSEILDLSEVSGVRGLTGQQVFNKTGDLIIQIEHYLDDDPEDPIGSARFKTRLAGLHHQYADWRTFVVDHVSGLTRTFNYYEEFRKNPSAKDPRKWVGETTSMIERYIATRLANLRSHNVVVLAHVDEQKDELNGGMIRTVKAPGRMRKGLADAYAEFYHGYVKRNASGQREYLLQTQSDALWMAASRLRPEPPDPCPAHYQALWTNSNNGNGKVAA